MQTYLAGAKREQKAHSGATKRNMFIPVAEAVGRRRQVVAEVAGMHPRQVVAEAVGRPRQAGDRLDQAGLVGRQAVCEREREN